MEQELEQAKHTCDGCRYQQADGVCADPAWPVHEQVTDNGPRLCYEVCTGTETQGKSAKPCYGHRNAQNKASGDSTGV